MYGTPRGCSSVPSPETKRAAVTSRAWSVGESPAALAMMIGGETTPAYIARMCCRPKKNALPTETRSSSGRTAAVSVLAPVVRSGSAAIR
ncbi:MAG: hypothetical protein JWP64_6168 [Pseudonocardia sp.]|jgi:hypothetical protein|nr:hypothetical protein [Pseudonocardia sp.]